MDMDKDKIWLILSITFVIFAVGTFVAYFSRTGALAGQASASTVIYLDSCVQAKGWETGKLYILTQNLTVSSSQQACFEPNVNNIVIDCAGHAIVRDGKAVGYGVNLQSRREVTIRNCHISGFQIGIHSHRSNNNVIEQTILSKNYVGATLSASSSNTFLNNDISSNMLSGVQMYKSSTTLSLNNVFTGNTICYNRDNFKCNSIDGNSASGSDNKITFVEEHLCSDSWPRKDQTNIPCPAAAVVPSSETSCTDKIDNDNDGKADCYDADCVAAASCLDTDKDTILDTVDNCKNDPNENQRNIDSDAFGDVCDLTPCGVNTQIATNGVCSCTSLFKNVDGNWNNGCEVKSVLFDLNDDGCMSELEIKGAVDLFYKGEALMGDVVNAINLWINPPEGCYIEM